MVGSGRFELPTSSLSGTRSNQLSYEPMVRLGLGSPHELIPKREGGQASGCVCAKDGSVVAPFQRTAKWSAWARRIRSKVIPLERR